MFGFILDVFSAGIGVVLPIYKTWKTIRSRKTTQLVPLAKYWSVFGVYTIIESAGQMLYLPYILPGYSFIKFFSLIYIYTSGYQQIFDNVLSPFLKRNEPIAIKCIYKAIEMGGRLLREVFAQVINFTVYNVTPRNVYDYNVPQAITNNGNITQHSIEFQEDDDVFFTQEDVKPEISNLRTESNNLLTSDSDSDYVEITKQVPRKTNRRRTTRAR